jgi:glycosyltransferase involved in cell wall biosynthesis
VDLVHVSSLPYSSLLYAGIALAEHTAARLVISPFTHVAPPGPAASVMRSAYLSPLNVGLLSKADRIFVQTELERRALADAGISTDRQITAGLGVERAECTGGSRERARESWRLDDNAVVVGHLANKSWDKGTIDLLDAAERLWDRGVRFVLVLAGPEMPSFTRRRSRARFPQWLVNLGELSAQERKDFFAAVDVFALPSYVESFGLSPLEAALNGAAVIAYDHGGPGQLFRNGDNALLAPAGDRGVLSEMLERLTTNARERARLGGAACRLAGGYSWSRVLDVISNAYDDLLANQPRR